MKKNITFLFLCFFIVAFSGCSIQKAMQMADCNYSFQNISKVSWAGIDFIKTGTDKKNLALQLFSIGQAISNKDYGVNVEFNLKAHNPNKKEAAIAGFDYILLYKGKQIGTGSSTNLKDIVVLPGSFTTIPLSLQIDLGNVFNANNVSGIDGTLKFLKDIIHLGSEKTDFSIKMRPIVRVGGTLLKTSYISIDNL